MKPTYAQLLFALFGLFQLSSKHFLFVSGQGQGGEGGEGGEGEGEGEGGEGEGEGGSSSGGQGQGTYQLNIACNYIYGVGISATTTDVCIGSSLASGTSSYMYSCNDDGDEVTKYSYTTADCSGSATLEDTYSKTANMSFKCNSNDCSIQVKVYENVTDNCDSVSQYYNGQVYVESACTTVGNDSEKWSCGNNTVIKRHYKDSKSCTASESNPPSTDNLEEGCNYIETQTDSFYSYSEIVECNYAPTPSPTESAGVSIFNYNMYYTAGATAVGLVLSAWNV